MGFWGPHCIYEKSCRRPHEVLDLEITISLGNNLCNVARSKIDLQKKKGHHLSSISKVINSSNFRIVQQGFEGREFDTPALKHIKVVKGAKVIDMHFQD